MARFHANVKLYVLDKRNEGERWKAIKQGIKEKFNIEPPTVRAMQKWEKNLDRLALSREFMKDVREHLPAIEADAQVQLAQRLIPMLWEARDAGQDIELSGWKWFFRLIESQLGSSKFEHLVREYMSEREKAE